MIKLVTTWTFLIRNIFEFLLLAVTSRHNLIILQLEFLLLHRLFLAILNKMLLEVHKILNLPLILLFFFHFSLQLLPILKPLSLFFTFPHLFIFLHLFGQITFELYACKRAARNLTCVLILVSARFFLFFRVVINFVTAMMRVSYLFNDHFSFLFFFFKLLQFGFFLNPILLDTFKSLVYGQVSIFVKSFTSLSNLFLHFFASLFLNLLFFGGLLSKLEHLLDLLSLNLVSTLDFIFLDLEEFYAILHLR